MEDLMQLYEVAESCPRELEQLTEEWLIKLRIILWGSSVVPIAATTKQAIKEISAASPQQTKKRAKRLSSLNEDEAGEGAEVPTVVEKKISEKLSHPVSPRKSKRSNADLLAIADTIEKADSAKDGERVPGKKSNEKETAPAERKSDASNLMPPPPAPVVASAPPEEVYTGRPQRAAKLKSEKNLKEPTIKSKLRRPSDDSIKVKLEHEQRASQMHEKAKAPQPPASTECSPKESFGSSKSNDSVVILPPKKPTTIEISGNSDDDGDSQATITVSSKDKVSKDQSTASETSDTGVRHLRIKVKREKVSNVEQEVKPDAAPTDNTIFKAPDSLPLPMTIAKTETTTLEEFSVTSSSILSATSASVVGKKTRKKKEPPRPIKVERFSDIDQKPSPVASRTRHGSTGRRISQDDHQVASSSPALAAEEPKRPASIYEDAVETPPSRNSKEVVANETVNLGPVPASDATMNLGPVPADGTFCTNPAQTTFQVAAEQNTFIVDGNPNATVTLDKHSSGGAIAPGDATFDIHSSSKTDKDDDAAGQRSFETAKDTSMPHDDSLITDDESIERPAPPTKLKLKPVSAKPAPAPASAKITGSAKANYKMPARTNELFNPLAQSPVKMRVEAFENAAAAASSELPKRPLRNKKENVTPTSATTPIIGKLPAPALGRFLTPTQTSNLAAISSAIAKKTTTSASKAMPLTKSASATLHRSGSNIAAKTLQRENSADDFRKGLQNLAEERKKQREQKHLLAAQQREAKERERAERMAKLAKEREEKRQQKQQEQEQKKRELEEIQRKLRLQQEEEAARIKAVKEREMLLQIKHQQQQQLQMAAKQRMLPPPPKNASKYTFDMLHEDDSTDDEDKVSYKRPPPPSWSRSHKRGPYVLKQEYTPSCYIDSFFSVQPMTPDLKQIFPNIDARQLKRNSSVLWSTPPRYSELPKY